MAFEVHKIRLIKLIKGLSGCGLKEAIDAAEALKNSNSMGREEADAAVATIVQGLSPKKADARRIKELEKKLAYTQRAEEDRSNHVQQLNDTINGLYQDLHSLQRELKDPPLSDRSKREIKHAVCCIIEDREGAAVETLLGLLCPTEDRREDDPPDECW